MDQNFTPITDDLLVKYLLGEATVAEQQDVKAWVEARPENQKQLEDFKAILEASKQQPDLEIDAKQALQKLNTRIDRHEHPRSSNYKSLLRWAAIFVVVFGGGLFGYQNTVGSRISVNTFSNTLTKELPDGSIATLNKHSSISYEGGFFAKTRQVKLKGEAFFKVTENKRKPFIIEVNGVEVTVVGTAFNVRNTGDETLVSVESGIVKVAYNNKSIQVTAGEKAEVNDNQLSKGENHGNLYNYYHLNKLICDGTPLHELVAVLNRKFNSKIVIINPNIKDLPLSTTFENNSLKEILAIVSETLKVNVVYGQGIIELK